MYTILPWKYLLTHPNHWIQVVQPFWWPQQYKIWQGRRTAIVWLQCVKEDAWWRGGSLFGFSSLVPVRGTLNGVTSQNLYGSPPPALLPTRAQSKVHNIHWWTVWCRRTLLPCSVLQPDRTPLRWSKVVTVSQAFLFIINLWPHRSKSRIMSQEFRRHTPKHCKNICSFCKRWADIILHPMH